MAQPTDYSTFGKLPAQERPATPKQRKDVAGAAKEEAAAAVAPALTRAQLRAAELQAQEAEAKLAEREEEKAGEAAAKEAAAEASMGNREQALLLLQLIQRAKDAVSKAGATGITAQITGGLFGTPAINLDAALEPIRSSTVLSAMAEARKGSAVGATGFGALDRGERAMLASSKGSLSAAQSPENIIQSLENIDRLLRYGLSREAGYDPRSPEGAALFRLPMPESAKDLPLPSGGDIKAGRWDKKPELAGIDAAISSMIKSGRSAEQIRQYLNEYQPGLGDETENLEVNIDFWKATGRDPNVTVERFFVPEETGLIQEITDTPGGAGTQAALNQLSMGVSGLIPGETGQQIRAVQRGLAEKYPTATTIGNVLGGIGSAASGTALAGKLGLKLPGLLEGVVQEGFRGAAMAEPGERFGGAAEGSLTALGGNVLMKPVSSLAGNILRGATPDAATLSQKYDITLSPGQLSGVDEGTLAGLPLVGGQVQARRNESLTEFNKAAFKDALAPIGVDVGAVGQKGIASAQEAVSDAYDEALGGLILNLDQPMLQAIRGKPYAELGKLKDIGPELQRSVDEIFTKYADPQNGAISGGNLQAALIEIRQLENAYKQDPRWANRIKPALSEISDGYTGALERQAPENFELFKNANTAYRNLSVLEGAVLKAPDGDIFGPGNLRTATNQATNKFGGRKAAARGDKPFNELIQAATDIVPKKADEVSLAGRMFPAGAGAGVGVGGVTLLSSPSEETSGQGDGPSYIPPSLLAAGLGAGLASLPYSRGGTRLANVLMGGQRSENQRLLGDLIANYMTPAVRGAFIGATSEPGVPMPQEQVDPGLVVSPEMREALLGSPTAETGEPPAPPMGGFEPTYTDVDALGRRIDPLTGLPIEEEEAAEGFKRGGMVEGYKKGGAAKQTSWYDDMVMAASRRGNDLVAAAADLADRYGVTPANAAAWIAKNVEGRSPQEVARIRQNLQPLGSNRAVVEAGAASNERRFREAGGRGARTAEQVTPPTRLSAAAYRPQDVPRAILSETPRALSAVRDYAARSTPSSLLRDAQQGITSGVEAIANDPYSMAFDSLLYAAPQTALMATPFDYAGMREGSKMLADVAQDPYVDAATRKDLQGTQRMVDALSVLPLAAPAAARRVDPRRARKKTGGLAAKRKAK